MTPATRATTPSRTPGDGARTTAGYAPIAELPGLGSAPVYLARAPGTGKLVSLRRYAGGMARSATFVGRFVDEAQPVTRLRHPNVIATLGVGRDESGVFVASEYVEGDTLLELMRHAARSRRPLDPSIAVRIALDALRGLHAAHEMTEPGGRLLGIVHRAISPLAVHVGADGVARVMDFQLTRAGGGDASTGVDGEQRSVARMGYLAPEQVSTDPIDRRADVFSMGVVVWECFTGRRLFPGRTAEEVLRALLVNPIPRLGEAAPLLPRALDEVLARALARGPRLRWPTALDFAEALEVAAGAITVAPSRSVGDHVRAVAGEKITRLARLARGSGEVPVGGEHEDTTQRRASAAIEPEDLTLDAVAEPSVSAQVRMPRESLVDWAVVSVPTPVPGDFAAVNLTPVPPSFGLGNSSDPWRASETPAAPRATHRTVMRVAAVVFVLVAAASGLALWSTSRPALDASAAHALPTVPAVPVVAARAPVPAAPRVAPVAIAPVPTAPVAVAPVAVAPVPTAPIAIAPVAVAPVASRPAVSSGAHAVAMPAALHAHHASHESAAPAATTPAAPPPASNEPYNPEAM